jgi:hypothetical protein
LHLRSINISYPFVLIVIWVLYNIAFCDDYSSLKISTVPECVRIYIDSTYYGFSPIVIDSLKCGKHSITGEREGYKTIVKDIYINEPQLSCFIELQKLYSTLELNVSPSTANIKIDNKSELLRKVKISYGKHVIKFNQQGYYSINKVINIEDDSTVLDQVNLKPKNKTTSVILSTLLPGSGQIYSDRGYIGYPVLLTSLVGIYYLSNPYIGYNGAKNLYNKSVERYRDFAQSSKLGSTSETVYNNLKEDMYEKYEKLKDAYLYRNIVLAITSCIWIYNIWDAYYHFPIQNIEISNNSLSVTVNVYF